MENCRIKSTIYFGDQLDSTEMSVGYLVPRNDGFLRTFSSSFATDDGLIMDNVPLAMIGKLLGHLLPETTAKYAHLSDDVIADAAVRISGNLAQAIGLRQ